MTGDALKIISWLYTFDDKEKLFDIKEHKEKRSLSQNAYAWELIGKLADAMRMSKEEMYVRMLQNYGQSLLIPVELNTCILFPL